MANKPVEKVIIGTIVFAGIWSPVAFVSMLLGMLITGEFSFPSPGMMALVFCVALSVVALVIASGEVE